MDSLFNAEILIALATLTTLEIVLGSTTSCSFPSWRASCRQRSRRARAGLGLMLAMGTRILLLASLAWIIRLTAPLFTVFAHEISGRDLILLGGGLFLIGKATYEIHDKLEGETGHGLTRGGAVVQRVIVQIMLLDIVFSLDSVITAVGMVDVLWVMIAAVVLAVVVMMVAATPISAFVHKHPTVKILALSFLILIGVSLVGEGLEQHIPKGYIYFAMAFSMLVEMINLRIRGRIPWSCTSRTSTKDDGRCGLTSLGPGPSTPVWLTSLATGSGRPERAEGRRVGTGPHFVWNPAASSAAFTSPNRPRAWSPASTVKSPRPCRRRSIV